MDKKAMHSFCFLEAVTQKKAGTRAAFCHSGFQKTIDREGKHMQPLDYKAIGLRIRKQRTFLNMSRDELARKVGITPTFLADIELGTKGFFLKSLNRFCDVLKNVRRRHTFAPENTWGPNIQPYWSF